MRKLLLGGIALFTTMLLTAEDTKVSSYTWTIDQQMNRAADDNAEPMPRDNNQQKEEKKINQESEQLKWNKLTDGEKHKLQAQRTEKRDEGLALINKRMDELNTDSAKLTDKRNEMLDREKFNSKQKDIDQKKNRLMEMKTKLENGKEGENVDLEAPLNLGDKVESTLRHK